ncbi:MAG: prepilin-type N-terminal cleavage/methylation domain-containing protein [Alteromonas stellipolaris]|uniref:pilus assembly FimT family protein n=1 Tax=Alteromonas stellipolaris TaxID=233316 RepID=UPI003B8B92B4
MKRQRGFTFLELMVSVTISALLAAIAYQKLPSLLMGNRIQTIENAYLLTTSAVKSYYKANCNVLSSSTTLSISDLVYEGYLQSESLVDNQYTNSMSFQINLENDSPYGVVEFEFKSDYAYLIDSLVRSSHYPFEKQGTQVLYGKYPININNDTTVINAQQSREIFDNEQC